MSISETTPGEPARKSGNLISLKISMHFEPGTTRRGRHSKAILQRVTALNNAQAIRWQTSSPYSFFRHRSSEGPRGISAGHHVPRNLVRSTPVENDQAIRRGSGTV